MCWTVVSSKANSSSWTTAVRTGPVVPSKSSLQQDPGRVVGRFHARNSGIAAAWKTGTAAARGKYVCVIDADLQYQPEDILRLHRTLIESSVDLVQGWRSAVGREKDTRFHLSRGLNAILNTAFDMSLHDNKSGFVICEREVMQDLLSYEGNYHFWQSFIMVAAHAKGYAYRDLEILFESRKQGTSFLDKGAYRASLLSFADIGKALWEYRLHRPVPDVATHFLKRYPVIDRTPKTQCSAGAGMARIHGELQSHALDDHAGCGALLRHAEQDAVADDDPDARTARRKATSARSPCLSERTLLPSTNAGRGKSILTTSPRKRTFTSCRCCRSRMYGITSTSTSCRRTTTSPMC